MSHATQSHLPSTTAVQSPRLGRLPFWLVAVAIVATIGSWMPLVFIARGRVAHSNEPAVMYMQDMYAQPKYREQAATALFADGRAMRPRVEGTVPHGMLDDDDHYYRGWTRTAANGKVDVLFFDRFPAQVAVDGRLLQRGQERFGIYCAACHGLDGYGNGPVNARAKELKQGTWTPPSNLHDAAVRGRPAGHIFNTISVGIRNMPAYGGQIPVADRWAIVAYVRALQLSQNPPANLMPQEDNAR
ncbi:MAG: cytochrome c [Tepidisphaeraceae bacterium]|jgi:mono/diheme cytochrome c family protein